MCQSELLPNSKLSQEPRESRWHLLNSPLRRFRLVSQPTGAPGTPQRGASRVDFPSVFVPPYDTSPRAVNANAGGFFLVYAIKVESPPTLKRLSPILVRSTSRVPILRLSEVTRTFVRSILVTVTSTSLRELPFESEVILPR